MKRYLSALYMPLILLMTTIVPYPGYAAFPAQSHTQASLIQEQTTTIPVKTEEQGEDTKKNGAFAIGSLASAVLAHILVMAGLGSPVNIGLLALGAVVLAPLAIVLGMAGLKRRLKLLAIIGGLYGILVFVPGFILLLYHAAKG